MNFSKRGLILAALQIALVASVGAKFALDRARSPRVWVQTLSFDPSLPIRGRYIAMQLPVAVVDTPSNAQVFRARLFAKNGQLAAERIPDGSSSGVWVDVRNRRAPQYVVQEPVLFFLPEHAGNAQDLMTAARNGELWVEVTVPDDGLPRPIRVGIKHGNTFTPIEAK